MYESYNLNFWNVWGTDNVGKIKADGSKFFYLKDHLGTIRVVLNEDNQIVSAQDGVYPDMLLIGNCWGYPLENRSYQTDSTMYKFTGKQRDTETGYDYFGARYYDARIGNWTTTEPLFEERIDISSYSYVSRNPMGFIDLYGLLDDFYIFDENGKYIKTEPNALERLVIENSETGERTYYRFNDPVKDVPWMKELISLYHDKRNFVYPKSNYQIRQYMKKSGVSKNKNKKNKWDYAKQQSPRNGKMDYWRHYLVYEMAKSGLHIYDIHNDKGGFYLFPQYAKAYNAMDAGNFLWGRGMRELGFPYIIASTSAHIHALIADPGIQLDSEFDQAAIKDGYYSK